MDKLCWISSTNSRHARKRAEIPFMQKKLIRRKIKLIQEKSLFTGRYAQGILQFRDLEKRVGSGDLFLYSYGILYDHLAMQARGQKKLRLERLASSYYQQGIIRKVGGFSPYWGLGRILIHNKKYAAGLRYYRKACNMQPGDRKAHLAYAVALYWAGRAKEAKELFLADYKKYGSSFQVSFNMAGIEKKLGNRAKSRAYAVEALRFWRRNKYRRTLFGKAWEKYLEQLTLN